MSRSVGRCSCESIAPLNNLNRCLRHSLRRRSYSWTPAGTSLRRERETLEKLNSCIFHETTTYGSEKEAFYLASMSPRSREAAHDRMSYIANNAAEHSTSQPNRAPMEIDDLSIPSRTACDASSTVSKVGAELWRWRTQKACENCAMKKKKDWIIQAKN